MARVTDMRSLVAAWWDDLPADQQRRVMDHRGGELPTAIARSLTDAGIPVAGTQWTSNGPGTSFTLPSVVQDYLDEQDGIAEDEGD
jgi:hypothetical protein